MKIVFKYREFNIMSFNKDYILSPGSVEDKVQFMISGDYDTEELFQFFSDTSAVKSFYILDNNDKKIFETSDTYIYLCSFCSLYQNMSDVMNLSVALTNKQV